jgi:4-hydroxyphenylacetate 3-monooxygenase
LRTGRNYLESLSDGRQVFLDGELVKDVTKHPALTRAAQTIAHLYDLAAEPALRDRMTFASPRTGQPVLRAYQIPTSTQDLKARRLFSETWAEATFGLMGRTPDHVAGFFCGFAAAPEVFAAGGEQFSKNVVNFYEKMRDNHLYASYAIVPPQIDRSKPAHKQSDPTLYAGIVAEKDGGIVLKGAQQLATGGLYSDYIYLTCIHPLQPGDENYAIGVAIPANAPGLKLYPRRTYGAVKASLDYPLSGRFDEVDCFVVLDNVFVPWEQVFIHRNINVCRDQWWKTPAHAYGNCQAQTRYTVKLRFMIGLAKRINELTGNDSNPAVQVQMGELAALVSIVENMLLSQEAVATTDNKGVLWPSRTALYSVMALQSELNSRMLEIIRELSGAAMITLPSSAADFENPAMMADIERYMQSGTADARTRVAVMRMAWDFIGTEFGSRQQQYEKFYGGASFLVKANLYRNFDFARATGLVEKALRLPAF